MPTTSDIRIRKRESRGTNKASKNSEVFHVVASDYADDYIFESVLMYHLLVRAFSVPRLCVLYLPVAGHTMATFCLPSCASWLGNLFHLICSVFPDLRVFFSFEYYCKIPMTVVFFFSFLFLSSTLKWVSNFPILTPQSNFSSNAITLDYWY